MDSRTALAHITNILQDRREAIALLTAVLAVDEARLIGWPETLLTAAEQEKLAVWLARRAAGEPLAYLVGMKEFWSLPFTVTPDTLIPRPETELLVETVLKRRGAASQQILDIGTGSGAIACALASERPNWNITATDISAKALEIAQENATTLGLAAMHFYLGDCFAALPIGQRYDMIVSNPPYLSGAEWQTSVVLHHEPAGAFVAADRGLAIIAHIFENAKDFLQPGGEICIEHGYAQGPAVYDLAYRFGYVNVETLWDAAGHPRICWAAMPDTQK